MEKPSILNAFEYAYNNKGSNKVDILIDVNCILQLKDDKLQWKSGSEESMDLLADRFDDTVITIYHNFTRDAVTELCNFFKRNRILCNFEADPVNITKYDIIISNKSGFNHTDFPAIKRFLKNLN